MSQYSYLHFLTIFKSVKSVAFFIGHMNSPKSDKISLSVNIGTLTYLEKVSEMSPNEGGIEKNIILCLPKTTFLKRRVIYLKF